MSDTNPELTEKKQTPRWLSPLLACVWLVLFHLWFYGQTLPNAQRLEDGSRPTRWRVWEYSQYLPTLFLDTMLGVQDPGAAPAGFSYLPQRAGFLLVAGIVYLVAYAAGSGLLTLIGCKIKMTGRSAWHGLSLATGLSLLSLLALALGLAGLLNRAAFLVCYLGLIAFWAFAHVRSAGSFSAWQGRMKSWGLLKYHKYKNRSYSPASLRFLSLAVVAPFVILMLLGAMLPSIDFDVKEYHFGGPKEYYLAGQIEMLPHNVYTSFPFLTEMLTLTGMVLTGDWYWGAVAGKTILMGFAPLTALLVYCLAARWFGAFAGWMAVIVHLSIPWTYRISVIAYTEGGLSLFLAASLLSASIAIDQMKKKKMPGAYFLMTGFLCGSAASCKYPGLISVTLPIAIFLLAAYLLKVKQGTKSIAEVGRAGGVFVLGTVLSFGPWLLKNAVETGNPVYPLLYSVFGGTDWDAGLDAKWKAAHSPDHHELSSLGTSFLDVFLINDWQSPLVFSLVAIALFAYWRSQSAVRYLGLYLLWLFFSWWLLTHRIDRFWVPLLPAAAVLAGIGLSWLKERSSTAVLLLIAPSLYFNLAFITTELCGYNAFLIDLEVARKSTAQITSPETVFVNQLMEGHEGSVLSVGEAELFDARFDYQYNTVFDRSLFAKWVGQVDRKIPEGEWQNRPAKDIRQKFEKEQLRFILVNWQEILRYRTTYGYTDFVTPERFDYLLKNEIIGPAIPRTPFVQEWQSLSAQQQQEIETWAPELKVEQGGRTLFVTTQVFPVQNL